MKRSLKIAAIMLVSAMLCSCDLYQPDVESLLTPPLLSDLQVEVDDALRDVVGQDLHLHYPVEGDYRSPYLFFDLDQDGNEEALVFYSLEEDDSTIYLHLMSHDGVQWRAGAALPGKGAEVAFVQFCPLYSAEETSILVGWNDANRGSSIAAVYSLEQNGLKELYATPYDRLAIADFDKDGTMELLTARRQDGILLRLIGAENGALTVLDSKTSTLELQTLFQPVIGDISRSLPGIVLSGRINADITAAVAVGVQQKQLLLPQEEAAGSYRGSYCYSGAQPTDSNGDGIIDLPWSTLAPGYSAGAADETRYFTEYRVFETGAYYPVTISYENVTDGWRLLLPEGWLDRYHENRLSLVRQAETREVIFFCYTGSLTDRGDELLRLRVVTAAESAPDESYTLLAARGQFNYYAKLPAGSDLTAESVQKVFSLLG